MNGLLYCSQNTSINASMDYFDFFFFFSRVILLVHADISVVTNLTVLFLSVCYIPW